MKKFNRLIGLSVLLYMLAALWTAGISYKDAADREKEYKVEINRIYNSLSEGEPLDKLDLHSYKYVRGVTFLSLESLDSEDITSEFYRGDDAGETEIRPLYTADSLTGFLRFDYDRPGFDQRRILLWTQLFLGIMELGILVILFYLKYQLIRPFQRMSSLTYELAQGHFKGAVNEEKSRFFGHFMWGISQLKDKLDVTKKRELELQREKKLLLLSLSHDIKTPLNTIRLCGKALEEDLYQTEGQKKHAFWQIGEKAEEIERYVEEIMKNTREDILDISVNNGEFYLEELLTRVLATYREKCSIRMLELHVGNYENRLLKGDLERSLEVFENIFENAFKYGDGKKIEITFYEEDYCQLIRIFNTGIPVTDNEFNHIFESFYRAQNSEGRQGSGLGLYICREIMRKMGGEIFAEKQQNGMAFVLVFS